MDPCIGQEELSDGPTIEIYPNPADEKLNIHLSGVSESIELALLNIHGQLVCQEKINDRSVTIIRELDVSGLPAGVYSVRIVSNSQIKTRKIIIE